MELDAAIKIGTLLGFFGGLAAIWWKFAQGIGRLEETMRMQAEDLAELKENAKQQVAILTKIAVQDERITNLDRQLQDMKHGQGFIVKPSLT